MKNHIVEITAKTDTVKAVVAETAMAVKIVTVAMEDTMKIFEDVVSMIITMDLAMTMR